MSKYNIYLLPLHFISPEDFISARENNKHIFGYDMKADLTQKRDSVISASRIAAILCIVAHHCLCVYGMWPPNSGLPYMLPDWAANLSNIMKEFGLAVFSFISGFLLYKPQNVVGLGRFLKDKSIRILVPMIAFGLLYALIFPNYMRPIVPECINGTHLWYLPMIFLCMVVVGMELYIPYGYLSFWCVWLILLFVSHSFALEDRTLQGLCSYLPVFYLGFMAHKHDEYLKKKIFAHFWMNMALSVIALLLAYVAVWVNMYRILSIPYSIKVLLIGFASYMLFRALFQNVGIPGFGRCVDHNSFTIYLLHQFVINTFLFLGAEIAVSMSWKIFVPVLFVSAVLGSIIFGEGYEKFKHTFQKPASQNKKACKESE